MTHEILFSVEAYSVGALIFALQQAEKKAAELGLPLTFDNLTRVEVDLHSYELGGEPKLSVSLVGPGA